MQGWLPGSLNLTLTLLLRETQNDTVDICVEEIVPKTIESKKKKKLGYKMVNFIKQKAFYSRMLKVPTTQRNH